MGSSALQVDFLPAELARKPKRDVGETKFKNEVKGQRLNNQGKAVFKRVIHRKIRNEQPEISRKASRH